MINKFLRNQTLESFDYQWKSLDSTGYGLLTDPNFKLKVQDIICHQELCINPEWFKGRKILDAGCGNGRWTYGFLKLGAHVTAVDFSENALQKVNDFRKEFPHLETYKENLLDLSPKLKAQEFDLVFSWGVLHHTGDTYSALSNISKLVKQDGIIYIYLYGKESFSSLTSIKLQIIRFLFSPFSFNAKSKILNFLLKDKKLIHNLFDIYSPIINDRYSYITVESWLRDMGFLNITQTIKHSEIFMRGAKNECSATKYFLPLPQKPYWFETLKT